jgi:CheY-like chemotaxis protein
VVISVKDTGIGIPPEKLASIFEAFTQLDRSLERIHGGLGIGLMLVKRLVELHGGTVEALSEGLGKGSELVVHLPVFERQGEAQAPPAPSEGEQTKAAYRILVVDDNQESADSLATLLQIHGHATFVAYDGLEALAAAEQLRPEVVLLDIGLPKLNGYEVCRRIRERPLGKRMVLIALTGWSQEEDRRKSREAGFDAHLVKPVDLSALLKLLGSLHARR